MFQLCFLINHPPKRRLTAEFPHHINMMEQCFPKRRTAVTHGNTARVSAGSFVPSGSRPKLCVNEVWSAPGALLVSQGSSQTCWWSRMLRVSSAVSRLIFRCRNSQVTLNSDFSFLVKQPGIARLVVSDSSLCCCVGLFSSCCSLRT